MLKKVIMTYAGCIQGNWCQYNNINDTDLKKKITLLGT
jgi:hypothetical protein